MKVAGFEPLYKSLLKCEHGVSWKDSVASFKLNGIEECLKLEMQLKSGRYKQKKPKKFTITSPKKREIVSISFRDRVFQRSLNDNIVYPKLGKSFIYDNCACQKGKGTDFARGRLKCFLQRFYRANGLEGYILKCDIKGYYPNMSHKEVHKCFRKVIDGWSFKQSMIILEDQFDHEFGYNPGSQMVQIAGIALLNNIDHFVKETLKVKHYLRYMDDFILVHEDPEFLLHCAVQIKTKLTALSFSFNERKTQITSIKEGVMFLGFKFNLSDTGKVLMFMDPDKIKQERKKLKRLVTLSLRGEISRDKPDQCFESWKAHASKGNSFKMIERMTRYYNELWSIKI